MVCCFGLGAQMNFRMKFAAFCRHMVDVAFKASKTHIHTNTHTHNQVHYIILINAHKE